MRYLKSHVISPALIAAIAGLMVAGCKTRDYDSDTRGAKYTCVHHPEVVQDHPGTCPKCQMTLVKK